MSEDSLETRSVRGKRIDKGGRPLGATDGKKRQVHPNSLANLRPFKPGVSPNPGGLPKDHTPVARWMTSLGGYTTVELRAYLKPGAKKYLPVNKLIAIQQLLRATKDDATEAVVNKAVVNAMRYFMCIDSRRRIRPH